MKKFAFKLMAAQMIAALLIIIIMLSSCNNYFTPYKAANTGGKKCSSRNFIR